MRALTLAIAVALSACTATPPVTAPTPVPTHEPNTLNVTALLDLSGPRAPSGQPQRNAMQIWLDQNGGSAPVKLRLKFVDVAGSDAKLLLEFRRAAVDDRADVVIVGVPVVLDDVFGQAVQTAAIPVLLTLPVAEPVNGPGGRFAFALAPTPDALARAAVSDIVDRGLVAPMLLASDDSFVAVRERTAFLDELRRRGISGPTPVMLNQADGPQRVRAAAAMAKSVVLAAASAPYGDVIRGLPATLAAPVYLSYLTEIADVTNLRDQAGIVTWPGSRTLAPLSFEPFAFQKVFIQAFTDRHGPPSTLAAAAYDALGIVDIAARQAPAELDSLSLRVRIGTGGYAGVVTRYSFTPQRHAGFTADDLVYLRWDPRRSAPFIAPKAPAPIR
jgi:ABC-type branched-subunit amino acid transport system substrate-binding protein